MDFFGNDWSTAIAVGERGVGKTTFGARWLRDRALDAPGGFTAAVARTSFELTEMVARLTAVSGPVPPHFEKTRRRLVWPNEAETLLFSARTPDALRGHQFEAAWVDEVDQQPDFIYALENLNLATRLGPHPQMLVTASLSSTLLRVLFDAGIARQDTAVVDV